MADPHVAGDEALGCGTLCLQSSPALLAHPLITSAQCWGARRSPPAWWALPIPWLWWPSAESNSSHTSWVRGDRCQWRHLGDDGVRGWQRAQLEQMLPRRTQAPCLST